MNVPAYVEVAVELPVFGTFHYQVPEPRRARTQVGVRVLVPFGRRTVSGVVLAETDSMPEGIGQARPLSAYLELEPALSPELIELCRWVANYYEAPIGEVVRAALPAGTRRKATARVGLTEAGQQAIEGQGAAMTRSVREVLAALMAAGGQLEVSRLPAAARKPGARIDDLMEAGLAEHVTEVPKARIRDRVERAVRLVRQPEPGELDRAPAQRRVVEHLVAAGGSCDVAELPGARARALVHAKALVERGIAELFERVVRGDAWSRRVDDAEGLVAPAEPPELTAAQQAACSAMTERLAAGQFGAYLLYGITGSGKTEVYLHLIARALEAGRGAIVLVPEISLTPQLAARFRARFGQLVAVLHSGLTARERYDEWCRLRDGSARIALGARSAIFAPVHQLGAVVVDEEHDGSFKQDEGVRYHARDVALVRAKQAGAVCVLGSATPSMESFHGAQTGRLELLELPGRATARPLPEVELVDLKQHTPHGDSMLTHRLAQAVEQTLERGEQTILFLNRRGFNTFVVCVGCGHAFRCPSCSVSLTYHKAADRLLCHYCGHGQPVPEQCPACAGKGTIVRRGLGTERIAEAVAERFPQARVARLDRDTSGSASVERVLGQMARGEIDILVGTQMVAKGHDFPRVTLVGVLLADTGLSLPDFRAGEKTFQLLTQVAGRAGRGQLPGRVLIQSYRTDQVAVTAASHHDYRRFFAAESQERKDLCYPPFGHLVAIRIDGPNPGEVVDQARQLARAAAQLGAAGRGVTVLGPAEAPLARLKGRTRWHLWLRSVDRRALRPLIRQMLADKYGSPSSGQSGQTRVTVDVDPVSAL